MIKHSNQRFSFPQVAQVQQHAAGGLFQLRELQHSPYHIPALLEIEDECKMQAALTESFRAIKQWHIQRRVVPSRQM